MTESNVAAAIGRATTTAARAIALAALEVEAR
jgi:hypothetical protein